MGPCDAVKIGGQAEKFHDPCHEFLRLCAGHRQMAATFFYAAQKVRYACIDAVFLPTRLGVAGVIYLHRAPGGFFVQARHGFKGPQKGRADEFAQLGIGGADGAQLVQGEFRAVYYAVAGFCEGAVEIKYIPIIFQGLTPPLFYTFDSLYMRNMTFAMRVI